MPSAIVLDHAPVCGWGECVFSWGVAGPRRRFGFAPSGFRCRRLERVWGHTQRSHRIPCSGLCLQPLPLTLPSARARCVSRCVRTSVRNLEHPVAHVSVGRDSMQRPRSGNLHLPSSTLFRLVCTGMRELCKPVAQLVQPPKAYIFPASATAHDVAR